MKCQNNLKQLALGCLTHENATGRLPANGWGFRWTGDADRGNDWRQPGCWLYNILPYIEQQPLHDLGMGYAWNDPVKHGRKHATHDAPPWTCFTARRGGRQRSCRTTSTALRR